MSNITPINSNSSVVVSAYAPLSNAVKAALHGSLAAFAAHRNFSDVDRAANLLAYKAAMDDFDEAMILPVLEHLMLHNPRNPFPFTPQDLYEALKAKRESLVRKRTVDDYYSNWRETQPHEDLG